MYNKRHCGKCDDFGFFEKGYKFLKKKIKKINTATITSNAPPLIIFEPIFFGSTLLIPSITAAIKSGTEIINQTTKLIILLLGTPWSEEKRAIYKNEIIIPAISKSDTIPTLPRLLKYLFILLIIS